MLKKTEKNKIREMFVALQSQKKKEWVFKATGGYELLAEKD